MRVDLLLDHDRRTQQQIAAQDSRGRDLGDSRILPAVAGTRWVATPVPPPYWAFQQHWAPSF